MSKIFTAIIIFVVLIAVGWFGYQQFFSSKSTGNTSYKGKIVIGYTTWPGYVGLYLARDKGYFKEAGLDVELKKYDGFGALSDALISGEIQGNATVTIETINQAYQNFDSKVVIVVDYSNGSDGIISRSTVNNFSQMKGKKVAYEFGSLGEFFMRYALEQNNMTLKDIVPVNLDAENAAIALTRGEVDVATTYEPFMSTAIAQVNANQLYSSAEAPGLITDVVTFRSDFIEQHPDTVQAFVGAYFQGLMFWQQNQQEASELLGKELAVSSDEAVGQLDGIIVLDQSDNVTAFALSEDLQSIYGSMKKVNTFVASLPENTSQQVDSDILIEPQFIKNLK